jgi:hypothetical protein
MRQVVDCIHPDRSSANYRAQRIDDCLSHKANTRGLTGGVFDAVARQARCPSRFGPRVSHFGHRLGVGCRLVKIGLSCRSGRCIWSSGAKKLRRRGVGSHAVVNRARGVVSSGASRPSAIIWCDARKHSNRKAGYWGHSPMLSVAVMSAIVAASRG